MGVTLLFANSASSDLLIQYTRASFKGVGDMGDGRHKLGPKEIDWLLEPPGKASALHSL